MIKFVKDHHTTKKAMCEYSAIVYKYRIDDKRALEWLDKEDWERMDTLIEQTINNWVVDKINYKIAIRL